MDSRRDRGSEGQEKTHARVDRVLANSGATTEGFAEPRGWSLKWDGPSLPEDEDTEQESAPSLNADVR
jgi:hypothetical protein